MAGRNHLYIPGPTNVPNEILNAMHVNMEDHRSPVFPKLLTPLLQDLKKSLKQKPDKPLFSPRPAPQAGKLR
jgi:serine-glyoxylate aminotransferase apoenzyme (EC 2.6.1.45)